MKRDDHTFSGAQRLFVAVRLPDSVREALSEVQTQLRRTLPKASISWTRADNLHLTLRFLGAVPISSADEVKTRLRASLRNFGALALRCRKLGCFPDLRRPRVLWAGVGAADDRLPELHRRVDEAVHEFAAKPAEMNFVGHVTLARLKQIHRPEVERLAEFVGDETERGLGDWRCGEVELIASELAAGGSRYTTLDVFPL